MLKPNIDYNNDYFNCDIIVRYSGLLATIQQQDLIIE